MYSINIVFRDPLPCSRKLYEVLAAFCSSSVMKVRHVCSPLMSRLFISAPRRLLGKKQMGYVSHFHCSCTEGKKQRNGGKPKVNQPMVVFS